jgi:hypothetical protein
MPNDQRNRKNQPPTGEGKKQAPQRGEPRKLKKRSEVLQAQRNHPELNLGDDSSENAWAGNPDIPERNPKRPKAGR